LWITVRESIAKQRREFIGRAVRWLLAGGHFWPPNESVANVRDVGEGPGVGQDPPRLPTTEAALASIDEIARQRFLAHHTDLRLGQIRLQPLRWRSGDLIFGEYSCISAAIKIMSPVSGLWITSLDKSRNWFPRVAQTGTINCM